MVGVKDDGRPLFLQVAEQIENAIVDGSLTADTQVPSTNELAAFHRINPATAGKGINQLVADGILYKRRGIGMFVATDARTQLLQRRRQDFTQQFLAPLMTEASKLGMDAEDIKKLIDVWEPQR
ncbi:GntR family transcriptional regulator [Amycolatopsis sp. cmx-8-4]|uniref:GntR family transcriptional regulator n=1 Tax=Amycolatopsis sp. cmx-8-4 TaxID=2790947 RepID=UPI00397D23FE